MLPIYIQGHRGKYVVTRPLRLLATGLIRAVKRRFHLLATDPIMNSARQWAGRT